jgi:pyridoxine 5-phosphate synthase
MSIRLGVNIDHVATLRQVRGGETPYPNILESVLDSVSGGADQITIHLREDRRHIQLEDLKLLAERCPVDLNLEMAATDEMQKFALKYRPKFVCLVPEKRQELTTEGGLDVSKKLKNISKLIEKLKAKGIETSLFIGGDLKQVKASADSGGFAVEFHTGHWVEQWRKGAKSAGKEWKKLLESAHEAHSLGLKVHAGHGLDFETARIACTLPHIRELNIGHFLVCRSVKAGLESSVKEMKSILNGASS